MATAISGITEMNLPLERVREANYPFARKLFQSNRYFSEPGEFGFANQTSLAIVSRHTRPEEFAMLQKSLEKINPELQVATIRLHAIKRQIAQLENLNFILLSKNLGHKIGLLKVMNIAFEESIATHPERFNEDYIRRPLNLPNTLNSSFPEIADSVNPFDARYLKNSALDIDDLSAIVAELTSPETPKPSPAP